MSVMGVALKSKCNSAALVELNNHAGAAISRLKKIHPPAHIIIISPRHKMFEELAVRFSKYPEFDRTFNHQKGPQNLEIIQEKVEPPIRLRIRNKTSFTNFTFSSSIFFFLWNE